MKKAVLGFVLAALCHTGIAHAKTPQPTEKPVIFVFTSTGGGGHKAAYDAIQKLIGHQYTLHEINPFQDILDNQWGEDWYKQRLQGKRDLATLTSLDYGGFFYAKWNLKTITQKLNTLVQKHKPIMLLSLIPLWNGAFVRVAHEHNIPLTIVTTDGDLMLWTSEMKDLVTYPQLYFTLGFDGPRTRTLLEEQGFAPDRIRTIGFPIRQAFLQDHDKQALRTQFNIAPNDYTVMFLMGGAGSGTLYYYVQALLKQTFDQPTTLVICTGSDTQTLTKIEQLISKKLPAKNALSQANNLTIRPFGLTNQIAQLMACSDVLVTKPGPGSVYEGLHSKIPMIVDMTPYPLTWERANADLIVQNNWGQIFKSTKSLIAQIKQFQAPDIRTQYTQNITQNFMRSRFETDFPQLIDHILQSASLKSTRSDTIEQTKTGTGYPQVSESVRTKR